MTQDLLRAALEARLGTQYEIESLLGQGGMGSVYRAIDRTLHRPVAIKVISGDVALNPQLKERFLLEARTVAKLRHPNIVAVYSAGEADGLLYFVMELVPGESLRDLLTREGTVAPERAERILHELALALDYAHANGIVHRDVKPENILLDRQTGRAMLTDFGVARALENSGNMTGTGMILGSPRYMSPEQATGESTLDGRSDLYALALVGYEMFTGKPVVDSGNVAGMLVKHLTETPKPLAEAVQKVPEGTAVAIDRALAKDREQRWASGREMAEVIAASWTPTPGSGATRAIDAAKQARAPRKPVLFPLLAMTFALSLFTVFYTTRDRDGRDPRKSYAVVPFEVQSGNADVQWLRDGAVNMLTLALAQWTDLQVMDYERTLKYVADAGVESRRVDLESAQEIARRGGAGTLVMGQVSTTQDSLIVVARLYDVKSGRSLNTATRAAALNADPRGLFDDIARYLLDVAGGSTSASVDVARQTTTSLTAYRAYLDGVSYLNSWRLAQADSAFQVAIRADSTFALAHHKRALALGWGSGSGTTYVESARRAAELSDRLPPRQQALVRGHLALAEGLSGQASDMQASHARLREAQRIYEELVARDSLVAEGWYGLADAYFHDGMMPGDSLATIGRRMNRSIYGFRRAIAIDSTFHLAYSHLVQQYQMLASPQAQAVLDGDTVILLQSRAQLDAMGGLPEFERRRARASAVALEMARGWVRADPDAPTSHIALATSYLTDGRVDSALAVVNRALQRPTLNTPGMRTQRIMFRLLADQPVEAFADLRSAMQTTPAVELRRIPAQERMIAMAMGLNTAAAVGNAGEVERVVAYLTAADSLFPFSNTPMRSVLGWYTAGLRTGITGTASREDRALLTQGTRRNATGSDGILGQLAATSGGVMFAAYLATRDTLFSNGVRRLTPAGTQHVDLDALEALTRGDTATARRLAASFTPVDSLRSARFGFAGMRAYARAEVLAAVGDTARAIAYLEAIDPKRFNAQGLSEPGFAVYTRSFLTRGLLYEKTKQPEKAIAAYEEYLRRTADGDAIVEPLRREARSAVARLRDR